MGAVVGGVLLAYPILFALTGPAHLSGVFWPDIDTLDGATRSLLVNPVPDRTLSVVAAYGGYGGSLLPSGSYLGWGLIGVLVGGTAVWFRDRQALVLRPPPGHLRGLLFRPTQRPLGAGPPLRPRPARRQHPPPAFPGRRVPGGRGHAALIVDRVRASAPARLVGVAGAVGAAGVVGVAGAAGVVGVALAPLAVTILPDLPFTTEAVVLPRWYATVAPHLPPGRVLLSYPVAFSGIQVALAWQAVNHMAYSQAGGAGPEGTSIRAGRAAPGFDVLSVLSLGFSLTEPSPTTANLASVNAALRIWKVNTVVIAPEPLGLADQQGHDPGYAAAYMTAVLGRLPVVQAGAWVWDDVHAGRRSGSAGGVVTASVLQGCVRRHETKTPAGVVTASLGVPRCVAAHLGRAGTPTL